MPIASQSVRKPSRVYLRRGHPLTQGLTGAWPLFAGAGDTAHDVSGWRNHLTFKDTEPVANWITGPIGPLIQTDGTDDAMSGDGIDCNGSEFTVAFWFKSLASGDNFSRFAQAGGNRFNKPDDGWDLFWDGGVPSSGTGGVRGAFYSGGSSSLGVDTGSNIPVNERTFWVFRTNGSSDSQHLRVYGENGELSGSPWTATGTARGTTASDILVFGGGQDRYQQANYDIMFSWNRELNKAESDMLFADPLAPYITKPR